MNCCRIPELWTEVHGAVPAQLLPHAVRQMHPQGGAEDDCRSGGSVGSGCGGDRDGPGGVGQGKARRGLPHMQV